MKVKPIIAKPSKRLHPSGKKGAMESPDKVLASKVRLAIAKKEWRRWSTVGLYSLKTSDSAFGYPFCSLTDSLALKAAKQLLPCANLYRVGSFCLYDGKVTTLNRPVLVLDNKVIENEKV